VIELSCPSENFSIDIHSSDERFGSIDQHAIFGVQSTSLRLLQTYTRMPQLHRSLGLIARLAMKNL
jgi:hypothetical protein